MAEKKVKSTLVFEVLGRPKEHILEAMNQLIDAIGKEKGIIVVNKKVHDAKEVENKNKEGKIIPNELGKELFSTFSEVDIETDNIFGLIRICFKFMPAHVEITEPDVFEMNNFDFSSVLNEIIVKMHQYDALAKTALMQNEVLARKLLAIQEGKEKGDDIEVIEKKPEAKKAKKIKKENKQEEIKN